MKSWIHMITAILFLSVIQMGNANIRFGIMGGLNMADLTLEINSLESAFTDEVSVLAAYGIGGVLDLDIAEHFTLRIQPMLVKNGGSPQLPISDVNIRFLSSYIEVPVMVKASVGRAVQPYIMAGSCFGFLLDSKVEAQAFGITFEKNIENITKQFNFGLIFGAGISLQADLAILFLEATYVVGTTDIIKRGTIKLNVWDEIIDEGFTENDVKMKNRGFRLMCGLMLPLIIGK